MKKLIIEEQLRLIENEKVRILQQQAIVELMKPVIESLRGVSLRQNKRILHAFEKALPDYTVSFGIPYSWYRVRVWGNGLHYDNAVDIMFDYDNGETGNTVDPKLITAVRPRKEGGYSPSYMNHYYFRGIDEYLEKNRKKLEDAPAAVANHNAVIDRIIEHNKMFPGFEVEL